MHATRSHRGGHEPTPAPWVFQQPPEVIMTTMTSSTEACPDLALIQISARQPAEDWASFVGSRQEVGRAKPFPGPRTRQNRVSTVLNSAR
jgi:hypothetical protein